MFDFLIDNIFVTFGGSVFQQTNGIPIETNCALFLSTCSFVIMRLHSYRNFLGKKIRTISLNFTLRYIDDVLSLSISKFGDYVERIYPIEVEIKDTINTVKSASYLDLHLAIGNECRLETNFYDKRDFSFPIVNFQYLCSNIPAVRSIYLQIRACISYHDVFLDRGLLLTGKLLNQEFQMVKLKIPS